MLIHAAYRFTQSKPPAATQCKTQPVSPPFYFLRIWYSNAAPVQYSGSKQNIIILNKGIDIPMER